MSNILFLIGGPGSGKDLVIKELSNNYVLKEYNLEQLKTQSSINEDCIISSNAYKLDDIISLKESLSNKHNVLAIYIDVSDDVSRKRLSNRNLQESIRIDRLIDSKLNLEKFEKQFPQLYYFDNSFDISSIEIISQLNGLKEDLSSRTNLLSKRVAGENSAFKNKILYKKKIKADAKASISTLPKKSNIQLDKKVKDFVDQHLRNKLTHDLKKIPEDSNYSNFNTDKEIKKQKKISKNRFLQGLIPKKGIGPTTDTRETGDVALIQTYATYKPEAVQYDNIDDFLDEAIDSPNSADTGLFGMTSSPNVNQNDNKPLFGYQVKGPKNKNRKKNFETDKESKKEQNESTIKKIKKIFFKG